MSYDSNYEAYQLGRAHARNVTPLLLEDAFHEVLDTKYPGWLSSTDHYVGSYRRGWAYASYKAGYCGILKWEDLDNPLNESNLGRVRWSTDVTRELDAALDDYCRQHDLKKGQVIRKVMTDFLSDK